MNNRFIFTDAKKCIGCLNCELACAASHLHMSLDEALESGLPLVSRNQVVKFDNITAPLQCMHCNNPSCLSVCPHDAISYEDDFIKINEQMCVGCGCCTLVCPYGAIKMVECSENLSNKLALKCDLCAFSEEGPACVQNCPTKAIEVINHQEYSLYMLANS